MMIYHTGCDAHIKTCNFQHISDDGTLGLEMRVQTDEQSIYRFLDLLDEPTTMTLEAGRNYWWLSQLFEAHPKVTRVNVVDPRRSRKLAEELSVISGYGRAKNDRIDAEMLADQTRRGLAPTIHVPTPSQLETRSLNRHRYTLVINRTRSENGIQSLLAMHGVKTTNNDLLTKPDWKENILQKVPEYVRFIIEQLLDQIVSLNKQIDLCERELDKRLPESHPQMRILLSTPGIGIILARTIYTEIMDISYFKEPKYLVSYSGLAPITNESADRKGPVKLNRHCNHYLKYAFVMAAHHACGHENYRKKYEHDVKKHGKTIAKLNLARRITKTVYWMLSRQQLYKK
jgi:transposase